MEILSKFKKKEKIAGIFNMVIPVVLTAIIFVSLNACGIDRSLMEETETAVQQANTERTAHSEVDQADVTAVSSLVQDFGYVLKKVSLISDSAEYDIEDNYGDLVSKELITEWKSDPLKAPGRLTSGPWPERIEISIIENLTPYSYLVKGDIIEITSVEKETGGKAGQRPIEIIVEKNGNSWLIVAVSIGEYIDMPAADWETFVSCEDGISFKYPKKFPAEYIYPVFWPPIISISTEKNTLDCPITPAESSLPQRIILKTINSRTYCIRALSEGAAGSVYTDYYYSSIFNNRIITVNLVLQYPGCTNYDDRQKTECEQERQTFDLDNIIDNIIQTVQLEI
jgi:hypothetical protein